MYDTPRSGSPTHFRHPTVRATSRFVRTLEGAFGAFEAGFFARGFVAMESCTQY
jgi:hypothetical protein